MLWGGMVVLESSGVGVTSMGEGHRPGIGITMEQ